MPYTINWYQHNSTLHIELMGEVLPEDVADIHQISAYYAVECGAAFRLIYDATQMTDFPSQMVENIRHTAYLRQGVRDVVFIGGDSAASFMMILLSQMYSFRLIFANSARAARHLLLEHAS